MATRMGKTWRMMWVALGWLGAMALATTAHAEWATQSLTLHPGWNAVFLEVQPDDNSCEAVFDGLPVKSVWQWARKQQIQQFVQNPNELLPKSPDWQIYFPKTEQRAFLTDLFAVYAGTPYLIELDSPEDVTWVLNGRVSTAKVNWLPKSFNFAGFYLDPAVKAKFKDFLSYDPALAGQAVYKVTPDGKTAMVDTATETLEKGQAYWIYANAATSYAGPFSASVETGKSLDFQSDFTQGALLISNATGEPRSITVRTLPSVRPTVAKGAKDLPALSGQVALSFQKLIGWEPLGSRLDFTVAANSTERLPLAIRRKDMLPLGSKATGDGQYENVLQVSDGKGGLFNVAVKALADPSPAGLWVGNVTVNKVSEVARPSNDPNALQTTAASSDFTFRIIVHVDENGNSSLLQQVYLLKQEQQVDNSVPPKVVRPEKYFLITQDDLVPGLSGVALRDGKPVGRRITAPAFSEVDLNNDGKFDPVPMTGNVTPGSALTASITVDYEDPLNPFVHVFHPDHNNLDERFQTVLAEGKEAFTFTRAITLNFEQQDPEALGQPEWGDTILGGTYSEDLVGVHKRTIRVQGAFKLSRVSRIGKLNDTP